MSTQRRALLRSLPATKRPVHLVAYEMRPARDASNAHAAYVRALATAVSAEEIPSAPKTSRQIFTDGSGAYFTVHDSVDGPVTLPVNLPTPLSSHLVGDDASQFIDVSVAEASRGHLADLYEGDREVYAAAAKASTEKPDLVAQATESLLKGAIDQGLSALTSSLAGDANVLSKLQALMPGGIPRGGGVGDLVGSVNLSAGAGMLTGQLTGMAFGALNKALFGGIGDDSSVGSQLGALAGKKMMGKLESMATAELTQLIQSAIDPASVPAPPAGDAKSTGEKIEEFFGGVTSSATLSAARLGDTTAHDAKISTSAAQTLFNGLLAARALDYQVCPRVEPGPLPHVGGPVREGNPTVLIEGKPAACVSHMVICSGVGQQSPISTGSGNVLLGSQTVDLLPPPVPVKAPSTNQPIEAPKQTPSKGAGPEASGKDTNRTTTSPSVDKESQVASEEDTTKDKLSAAASGVGAGAKQEVLRQQEIAKNSASAKAETADRLAKSASALQAEADLKLRDAKAASMAMGEQLSDHGDAIKLRLSADVAEVEANALQKTALKLANEAAAEATAAKGFIGIAKIAKPIAKGVPIATNLLDIGEGIQNYRSANTDKERVQAITKTAGGMAGGMAIGGLGAYVAGAIVGGPVGVVAVAIAAGVGGYVGQQGGKELMDRLGGHAYDIYDRGEW